MSTELTTQQPSIFNCCYEVLDEIDAGFDDCFGVSNCFQQPLDAIAADWHDRVVMPLAAFSNFIDTYEPANTTLKVAVFVLRPFAQAVRNIIRLCYTIVSHAANLVVHPLKELTAVIRLIIRALETLIDPENWAGIGAGCIGASLGLAVIPGNPLSAVSLIVGGTLMISGLVGSFIKILYEHGDKENLDDYLFASLQRQCQGILESFVTGLALGVIGGAIVRHIDGTRGVNSAADYEERAAGLGRNYSPRWYTREINYDKGTLDIYYRYCRNCPPTESLNLRVVNPAIAPSRFLATAITAQSTIPLPEEEIYANVEVSS